MGSVSTSVSTQYTYKTDCQRCPVKMSQSIWKKLLRPIEGVDLTSITEKEGEFIYSFLKEKNIKNSLEVGLAYGCSTAYIISATQSYHYAIDPFQDQFDNLGLKNIKTFKLDKYLKFENDFSHNVLPRLLKDGVKIDLLLLMEDISLMRSLSIFIILISYYIRKVMSYFTTVVFYPHRL